MYAALSYACEERRHSDKLLSAVELYLLTSTLWPHPRVAEGLIHSEVYLLTRSNVLELLLA